MAEEKQDGQKTLVAFVVGLLIGGMLVWAFSGPTASAPQTADDEKSASEETGDDTEKATENGQESEEGADGGDVATPAPAELKVGNGDIKVADQVASELIKIDNAVYPVSEGWVGVRDYTGEQLGRILGVVRFSESQGLVPQDIILQTPTIAGKTYAVVVYTEDGDRVFGLAGDVQIDQIFDTFVAK